MSTEASVTPGVVEGTYIMRYVRCLDKLDMTDTY